MDEDQPDEFTKGIEQVNNNRQMDQPEADKELVAIMGMTNQKDV